MTGSTLAPAVADLTGLLFHGYLRQGKWVFGASLFRMFVSQARPAADGMGR